MNLIVDVGNTYVKFAVYDKQNLIHKMSFELSEFENQYKIVKKSFPDLKKAIISSVGYSSKEHVSFIKKDMNVLLLNSELNFPFINKYQTPKTLGVDRMALVSASVDKYPNNNVLIIDAGTCVTYDFVTKENHYLGGAISPGIRLRYKSLNNLTANLPLLDTEQPKHIIGDSTESSIHSGVINGIVQEIDGVIGQYQEDYSDLTVILTGGDAKFLSNQLKNSIFANSNFLLDGLNFILEYNSK
ncbi:type III pantothenate kinase [Winogradskyella epiphytica]|uniref:Type III pantothenate kinase n=1 Tax=Winogradskyella epiphytica TaxID=262005 RepID=A0A2V4XVI3_9FLAO|nr:type III pantothenate kinase [Winogradskyella epiphytica]PYE82797.1 type III pantothenate kinase [Winogradskyella epiphytica]GGW53691.1 type III pantothenate kinase [Winogradskyella epiphytica]